MKTDAFQFPRKINNRKCIYENFSSAQFVWKENFNFKNKYNKKQSHETDGKSHFSLLIFADLGEGGTVQNSCHIFQMHAFKSNYF